MAINFLNTVNFNKNSLDFARIQNLGTDPSAANSSIGQIYFNTVADTLKQYVLDDGTGNPGWTEVGSTTVKAGFGIGVTFTGGEATIRNIGLVTVLDGTYIDLTKGGGGDNTQLTADLSAVDGTSVASTRFLSKDNTWDVIDGGTVGVATATTLGTVKLFSDTEQTIAATGVSAVAARTYGVQFNSSDQMVVNVPWTDVNVVTYDLTTAPTGTAVRLTSSDAGDVPEDVTISGTTGQIAMSRISTTQLRVALTDDVTIIDNLTVGGVITQTGGTSTTGVNAAALTGSTTLVLTANNAAVLVGMQVTGAGIGENITITTVTDAKTFQLDGAITIANGITLTFEEQNSFSSPLDMNNNRINEVKTGVLGTDGVNLAQVNSLVAGIGVFKGGFNATTGLTVPGGQELEGASNIALDKGDYFVVTTAGSDFFTLALEPGDFIFAEVAIGAGSSPVVGDYIVVQADANVAGAGATDGATEKGVAGFDSANFTVSSNGWVQLKPLANPYGAKVSLTSGDNTTAGQTTFTVDVTALFTGADARNCKVEVLLDAGGLTVYPEVTRNGLGDVLLEFMPQVGNGVYSALITIV